MIGIRLLLHQLYDFLLHFTFPNRRWLLRALVVLAVIPGVFVFQMPLELRMAFAYPYVIVMVLGLYSVANVYAAVEGAMIQPVNDALSVRAEKPAVSASTRSVAGTLDGLLLAASPCQSAFWKYCACRPSGTGSSRRA